MLKTYSQKRSLLCLRGVQHGDNTDVKLFDYFTCFIISFRQQLSEVYGQRNQSILIMLFSFAD